jgi:hypothetical protein
MLEMFSQEVGVLDLCFRRLSRKKLDKRTQEFMIFIHSISSQGSVIQIEIISKKKRSHFHCIEMSVAVCIMKPYTMSPKPGPFHIIRFNAVTTIVQASSIRMIPLRDLISSETQTCNRSNDYHDKGIWPTTTALLKSNRRLSHTHPSLQSDTFPLGEMRVVCRRFTAHVIFQKLSSNSGNISQHSSAGICNYRVSHTKCSIDLAAGAGCSRSRSLQDKATI